MLTIKHRFKNDIPQFPLDPTSPLIEEPILMTERYFLRSKSTSESERNHELNNDELLERITKINDENVMKNRENLLFARYLLRITTSKTMESFDNYETEDNIISETLDQKTKLAIPNEVSLKKSINITKDGNPLWTKRSVIAHGHHEILYIRPIDQKRFFIATYELEQANLDWQRMKANAAMNLDQLKILYQNVRGDEMGQADLNRLLQRRVDLYHRSIAKQQYHNSYLSVPADLFVGRVHQRINSRIGLTGAFLVNSDHLKSRMDSIDDRIEQLEDITSRISTVDIDLTTQKHIHNKKEYEALNRKYIMDKSYLHRLIKNLDDLKKDLIEEETQFDKIQIQIKFLNTLLEQTIVDGNTIEQENNKMLKENNLLNNLIDDTTQAPTITEYAHIIKQLKTLRHDIHIWTQRANTAEILFAQLKQHNTQTDSLPPIKRRTTTIDRRPRSIILSQQ